MAALEQTSDRRDKWGRTGRVRFAPNVTGALHLGNARTALVAWLFARSYGLGFDLRLDDDPVHRPARGSEEERIKGERENEIDKDLRWLGLDWDSVYRLSERTGLAFWCMDNVVSLQGQYAYRGLKDYFLLGAGQSCMPAVIVSFFDDVMSRTIYHIRGTDLIPLEFYEDWLRNMCLWDKGKYDISFPAFPPPNYLYLPMLGDRAVQWHKSTGQGLTIRQFREAGFHPGPLQCWLLSSWLDSVGPAGDSDAVVPPILAKAQDPGHWHTLYKYMGKRIDGAEGGDGRRLGCTPFDLDQFYQDTGYPCLDTTAGHPSDGQA